MLVFQDTEAFQFGVMPFSAKELYTLFGELIERINNDKIAFYDINTCESIWICMCCQMVYIFKVTPNFDQLYNSTLFVI